MLSAWDDYPVHQTSYPVAHPGSGPLTVDRNRHRALDGARPERDLLRLDLAALPGGNECLLAEVNETPEGRREASTVAVLPITGPGDPVYGDERGSDHYRGLLLLV